ncbi:MAG: Gfo/Idh/MocA family protein, partial [Planctomycetota bacterium]
RLYSGKNELIISGEKGRIRVNRGGLTGRPVEDLTPEDEDRINDRIVKLCHGKDPSGDNGSNEKAGAHMHNFFDCIKDGGRTISDPWTHHRAVGACHLANIAMRLDRKLQFDPEKEDFVGDEEASAMLRRRQRRAYSIYI